MDKKRVINIFGALMFIGMGAMFVHSFFSASQHETAVKTWKPTYAVVYEVYRQNRLKRVGLAGVPQLETGIRYKYVFDNQTYDGEKSMSDGDSRTYAKGDQINVRVNPGDPKESDFDYVEQPGTHPIQ